MPAAQIHQMPGAQIRQTLAAQIRQTPAGQIRQTLAAQIRQTPAGQIRQTSAAQIQQFAAANIHQIGYNVNITGNWLVAGQGPVLSMQNGHSVRLETPISTSNVEPRPQTAFVYVPPMQQPFSGADQNTRPPLSVQHSNTRKPDSIIRTDCPTVPELQCLQAGFADINMRL